MNPFFDTNEATFVPSDDWDSDTQLTAAEQAEVTAAIEARWRAENGTG